MNGHARAKGFENGMDRRLLRYYDRELRHLQTVAREFAREYPKIASRLALDDLQDKCVDPYVERLLEGFAFLTARVQLKLDAEFPRFTQNLLETVYPHYLAPTPSIAIVQFQHDPGEGGLADGFRIPRGSVLRSTAARDETSCEYRTCHDTTLWPVTVSEARYYTRDVGVLELNRVWGTGEVIPITGRNGQPAAKAAIRLRLKTTAGLPFNKVAMKDIEFFLRGTGSIPHRLYEHLFAHVRQVVVRPVAVGNKPGNWQFSFGPEAMQRVGFSAKEAILPFDARSFQGYRLLHEYFAFPQRFMFAKVAHVGPALQRCDGQQIDIIFSLSQEDPELENAVDSSNFAFNCSPVVNLFPKRCDRIFISDRASEFQVIPDRTRPLDFEVYRVDGVVGFGSRGGDERTFRPFYAATDVDAGDGVNAAAYYAVNRVPRVRSENEKRTGGRSSSYAGSEVYLALVDASNAPFSADLRQLSVEALCTNRDMPIHMPLNKGKTDFTLDIGAPVEAIRAVAGPTAPQASYVDNEDNKRSGDASWRLVSHLALNYLSLTDEDMDGDGEVSADERQGAASLRDLMKLYSAVGEPAIRKQIEGLRSIQTAPITRRVPTTGAVAFARGLEVTCTFDENLFAGSGVFLLGAVLEQFFARYVSTNSFTETVVRSDERGEIMRWTVKVGQRPIL